ncbi:MAG TPA: hypothetical protein VGG71_15930 [Chitinophagaceae bacterium]|jgi:hypothetical protein
MKPVCIVILLFWQCADLEAQKLEDLATIVNKVYIDVHDTLIRCYAIKPDKNMKIVSNQNYYWYRDNTILMTMGGYDGRLLDGPYKVFYPTKNLIEEGQFKSGIKQGQWKSWYENGALKAVVNWSSSRKNGSFTIYDSSGTKTRSGNYKNDQLDGKITDYLGNGKTIKFKYNSGVLETDEKATSNSIDSTANHK